MFFLDFGNKCDVEADDIRCITDDLLKYPRLAQKYSLAHIKRPSDHWSPQSIEIMNACHSQLATVTCVKIESDVMECSLKLSDKVESVEESLLKQGLAVRSKQENNNGIDFPVEDVFNAIVMHVEDISLFHGQLLTSENINSIAEITSQLNELSSTEFDDEMQINSGSVCAGFHQEYQEWYRVEILNSSPHSGDTVLLKLLDYGDQLTMEKKQLRPLPSSLFKIPWKAIPMSLNGAEISQECSSNIESASILKQHILQNKCLVEVVRRHPEKLSVNVTCENVDCHNLLSQYLSINSTEGCHVNPAGIHFFIDCRVQAKKKNKNCDEKKIVRSQKFCRIPSIVCNKVFFLTLALILTYIIDKFIIIVTKSLRVIKSHNYFNLKNGILIFLCSL